MGIAYNKTTPTESNIYGDYEWNLTQGAQGNQGIPGAAGANGVPVYTWVKYANNATPTSGQMSDDPTGMVYMGLSYNQLSATEGTDYHAYSWSLIQGPQGPAGSTGNTGAPGAPGSSVGTVTPYWATVNYGASGPAKPTTATPIAPWVTTEPAFSVGTEQWRTEKTTLTDTTFSYSTPYKSSMYGAVATDRIAPSSSPTPEVIPGIGAFFLRWPAVANHDPVTYDVHISDTSGFTPGPTTLYDSTTAYSMTIRHLVPIDPNTTLPFPLLYDDPPGTKPYFFKIVARDADGSAPASAQVNQGLPAITSTDITARSVKADSIVTGSLTGDLFSGTVVLGSTISTGVIGADGQIAGARVDLGPLGLVVYDSTGTPITGFPLDPSQDAFVKQAHFDMLSADVQDNFSMHGKNNQLATESELTIAAGVTPPNAQPTVTVFYDQIQLDRNTAVRSNTPNPYYDLGTFALDPSQICAMAWINAWGGYWAVIQEKSNGLRFWRFNPNGTIFNNPVNGRPWVDDFNDRSNGGTCYDTAFSDSAFMFKQGVSGYYIIGYPPAGGSAITNTIPAGWILDSDTRPPTLAFDSIANRYILFQSTGGANGTWSARRFHLVAGVSGNLGAASSTGDGAVITGPASSGNSQRVNGLVYGNQIPGGSSYRYAISLDATLGIAVWDSAITARKLVDGSYEEWSKAAPSLGFCHDGTQFCSVDATGKITKYTSWNWPQANAVSYIGASAIATVPSPDYETPIGAQYAKFTSPRRAKIRIKMPETDGDGTDNRANKWGLYWYRGTSDPTTGAVFKQIGLIGSSTLPTTIDVTADPTGAPPPYGLQGKLDSINNPSGNFPAANPASIQSSALLGGNPTIALNGDGSGRLGQAYWDTSGNWSGIAGGSGGGSLDTYIAEGDRRYRL